MTAIPGERVLEHRRNFHGTRGEHLFPHPESYARRSDWTRWDRAYAAHLDEHRRQATDPSPLPGDGPAVTALFEHIESLTAIIAKEKLLIVALRQKAAQTPDEMDELDSRVRSTLREGGIRS